MKLPEFLTHSEAAAIYAALPAMSLKEKMDLCDLLEEKEHRFRVQKARESALGFAHAVYPGFKEGPHHRQLAKIFDAVIAGDKKRVIINIAPRMGKSEFSSYLFPSYFLGRFPDKKVIMGTHTASLSEDFGRRIKNLAADATYTEIFPKTIVSDDQKAAGKWSTSAGGQYYAVGVGGSIAGRGADLFIIDDPHSEQDLKSGTRTPFDAAWTWFQSGPLQRLMPGGAIIVIMCMTGDTDVLLADGTTRKLRDIRPGDRVATYEDGRISVSRINNARSNGIDAVYRVQTESGRILRANERHPFLVDIEGDRQWVRLKDLRPGMCFVATTAVAAQLAPRPNRGSATRAKPEPAITVSTLTQNTSPSVTTASGKAWRAAQKVVQRLFSRLACANTTTTTHVGTLDTAETATRQKSDEQRALKAGTESRLSSTTRWLLHAVTVATSATKNLLQKTREHTGAESSASTTATTQARYAACYATTATLQSVTEKHPTHCDAPLSTYSVFLDPINSIVPDGHEEVFDIEVDRTENFIANGVVSHNTRWSEIDLTGMLIKHQIRNPDADKWEIVELPAILNEHTPEEKSLWPQQWPLEQLQAKRAGMDPRFWQAQYMQNPTSEVAAIIKRDLWKIWEAEDPPKCEYIIQSWDTAHETKTASDYSACTVWGVWFNEEDNDNAHIILLDAIKGRWTFPDLKKRALEYYREWEPDACLIEKKAAGAPLIQELRAMGIPIGEFSPSRGKVGTSNDKRVRLNATADMFASGRVWAPDTRWAREVIEEVAAFPAGEHDDYVDTLSMALMRVRQGGFIRLPSDEPEEPREWRSHRRAAYY